MTNDERDRRDADLIARGDLAALLATYRPDLVRVALLRRLTPEDAQDVVQRTLLHVWRELVAGRVHSVPFRVVVHMRLRWVLRDHWAARDRENERVGSLECRDVPVDDPALGDAETGLDFARLLAVLTERQRRLVELVYVAGMGIAEAARELGMTRNAADQALHRARRQLREAWDA